MDHQQKTFSLYAGSWLMAHAPIDLTHDMRLRNQEKKMYSGRYELCAGKCTVEGTTKTILTSSLSLPTAVRRYSGTVLGSFFSSTIDTIDTIEPLSIVPNKHSTL